MRKCSSCAALYSPRRPKCPRCGEPFFANEGTPAGWHTRRKQDHSTPARLFLVEVVEGRDEIVYELEELDETEAPTEEDVPSVHVEEAFDDEDSLEAISDAIMEGIELFEESVGEDGSGLAPSTSTLLDTPVEPEAESETSEEVTIDILVPIQSGDVSEPVDWKDPTVDRFRRLRTSITVIKKEQLATSGDHED